MKRLRQYEYLLLSAIAFFFTVCTIFYAFGIRINSSASVPYGFYKINRIATRNKRIHHGDYVMVCMPFSPAFEMAKKKGFVSVGNCPDQTGYLLKRVAALRGDVVTSNAQGITVNGVYIPQSAPQLALNHQEILPHFKAQQYTLTTDEILLMGENQRASLDGRYFGLVHLEAIQSVVEPFYTWK